MTPSITLNEPLQPYYTHKVNNQSGCFIRQAVAQREEVRAFVNLYLSPSFTPLIQTNKVGYITLDPPIYEAISKRFNSGTTGTLFPKGTEVGATLERYLK